MDRTDKSGAMYVTLLTFLAFAALCFAGRLLSVAGIGLWPLPFLLLPAWMYVRSDRELTFGPISHRAIYLALLTLLVLFSALAIKDTRVRGEVRQAREIVTLARSEREKAADRYDVSSIAVRYKVRLSSPELVAFFDARTTARRAQAEAARRANMRREAAAKDAQRKRENEAYERSPLRPVWDLLGLIAMFLGPGKP